MEREFESEIGARISEGSRRRSSNRIGVLTAAAISCALLLGSAAFLLPAMSSAGEGKVVSANIYDAMDYLVYNEDNDCLIHYGDFNGVYDVKKSTNVKAMAYPPSVNAPGKYVKFLYTTMVHLDVVDNLELSEAVAISDLAIPYDSDGLSEGDVPITWTMTVDGVRWYSSSVIVDNLGFPTGDLVPNPVSASYDGIFLSASIALPALPEDAFINVISADGVVTITPIPAEYVKGIDVSIQVVIKVASPNDVDDYQAFLDGLAPAEDAFSGVPDSDDLPEAVIISDADSVSMGSTVKLDASESKNVDTYAWYLNGAEIADEIEAILEYTFAGEIPGDYTFKLVVTSEADLDDVAEVIVSVYDGTDPVAGIAIGGETDNDDGSVTVTFASTSTDNVGVVSYVWTIMLLDECKVWGDASTMTYTFVDAGTYTVKLTVYDEAGNSDTAYVPYEVMEQAP